MPEETQESLPLAATEPAGSPEPSEAAGASPLIAMAEAAEALEEKIVEALKTVFDPEIPVNIYEMGLIYDLDISAEGGVAIKMTLTSPACPVAGSLPGEVQQKVQGVAGVTAADVELVWDPVWNPSMMSEAARLELGMF
jgi:FeS assembly SUF system protein